MKDYLDELLEYYDIERTDKEGIWVQTDEGSIVPFIFTNKKEDIMKEKIKIKQFYNIDGINTEEWNLEILDKELALKGKGYEILPYKEGKEYIYIKYFNNGTYKLYDTGKCLTDKEIVELKRYIDKDINSSNRYYYIYLALYEGNAICTDFDIGSVIDKQRKEIGNYYKTYEQAKQVWNKIQQVFKESKEDEN